MLLCQLSGETDCFDEISSLFHWNLFPAVPNTNWKCSMNTCRVPSSTASLGEAVGHCPGFLPGDLKLCSYQVLPANPSHRPARTSPPQKAAHIQRLVYVAIQRTWLLTFNLGHLWMAVQAPELRRWAVGFSCSYNSSLCLILLLILPPKSLC